MADAAREAEIRAEALLNAVNALGELLENHEWPLADQVVLGRAFSTLVEIRRRDREGVIV